MSKRPRDRHAELREQLGVYALGQGTPTERAVIGAHLDACASCSSELAQLATTVTHLARLDAVAWADRAASTAAPDYAVATSVPVEAVGERWRPGRRPRSGPPAPAPRRSRHRVRGFRVWALLARLTAAAVPHVVVRELGPRGRAAEEGLHCRGMEARLTVGSSIRYPLDHVG